MAVRNGSVVVKIRIVTTEKTRDRALETFRSLVGQVRGELGCIGCRLLQDVHQPGDLTFKAEWRSQGSLERFVRSAGFTRLLAGIDLADEEPKVEVRTPTGIHGLDFFERVLEARSPTGKREE